MRRALLTSLLLLTMLVFGAIAAPAQDIAKLEKDISTFTLDNGLKFIVVERHDSPVFSYVSMCKVGSVNEVPGITGLAHMFEHMAFKGTDVIGTKDYSKEKKALDAVDEAQAAWWQTKLKGASDEEIAKAKEAMQKAEEVADEYVVKNEFGSIVEQAGGTGLNASTASDVTTYFYNLPSNKLQLWAYLESQRYIHPVLREFYKERDVVEEERRMRTESSSFGRLLEEFITTAYKAHPYGQPTVGHMSDLEAFTRKDALKFHAKYYVPGNVVMCLVGDVDPKEVQSLAKKYFGPWKAAPVPEPVRTVEPPQIAERTVTLKDPGQPLLVMGYHKPAASSPDDAAFDVLTEVMANGRSSRLYKKLVKEEQSAVSVGAFTGFPGQLYPGLFLTFAVPAKGFTAAQCESSILKEFDKAKSGDITAEELEGAKTRLKANWIRQVRSDTGMAQTLCSAQVILGDWQKALSYPSEVDAVTLDDLQRLCKTYLIEKNLTVGTIVTEEKGAEDAS
ncbi:MAG TPA: pitrilysin family protein [Candidatus Krumholzibacteria bacterium]|nr:pitrilysin family protein [Candidatus Krumholzibacteria bacterium]